MLIWIKKNNSLTIVYKEFDKIEIFYAPSSLGTCRNMFDMNPIRCNMKKLKASGQPQSLLLAE